MVHETQNCNSCKQLLQNKFIYAGILSWLGLDWLEKKEDVLITTIKRGILSMQKNDYNTAEQIFHIALKIAQERTDQQAQTYIFDLLANAAFKEGNYAKAEKLFIDVARRLVASGTAKNDNAIVEISLKLAFIYSKQKDDVKAQEGYKFCINTQDEKVKQITIANSDEMSEEDKDTVLLWAMSIDWYARYLLDKGQTSNAQDYFLKALSVSERINGPLHPQTLVLMNDIGSIATLRKDFSTALKYFESAIDRGAESGTNDLPSFYCNLGAMYLQKGDHEKAFFSCKEALKIATAVNNTEAEEDAKGCLEELKNLNFTM